MRHEALRRNHPRGARSLRILRLLAGSLRSGCPDLNRGPLRPEQGLSEIRRPWSQAENT